MTRPPAAAILAGGASRRFGSDKAAHVIGGRSALARVVACAAQVADQVVVVGGGGPLPPGCRRVRDVAPGGGPLQAVVAATRALPGRDLLVLACDLPWLTPDLLRLLAAPLPSPAVARVPRLDGRLQPLAALYTAVALAAVESVWTAGGRSMHAALAELACLELTAEDLVAAGIDPVALADFDAPEDLPPEERPARPG